MTDNPQACGDCPVQFSKRCSLTCGARVDNLIRIRQHERERRVWLPKYGNAIMRDNRRD